MADHKFMRLAIKEAIKSQEPLKCGAVIVKEGKIIAKAFNNQRATFNATGHAEIHAIRKACKKLKSKYLHGCTVYGNCEPCTMCLSALVFAEVDRIVFGVSTEEYSQKGRTITLFINEFLERSPNKIDVTPNFLIEECRKIL